jgi:hypothetical protein
MATRYRELVTLRRNESMCSLMAAVAPAASLFAGLVKYDERFQLARGFPHYSPQDLASAFEGLVVDPDHFVWKGIEIFCGRKP